MKNSNNRKRRIRIVLGIPLMVLTLGIAVWRILTQPRERSYVARRYGEDYMPQEEEPQEILLTEGNRMDTVDMSWPGQLDERDDHQDLSIERGEALEEAADKELAPDDLTVVEGIGPKIASILADAGIRTYRQLAEASLERLQSILKESNLRLANPETWSEQARLAAENEWDSLKELQSSLKGGRRQ